MRRRYFLTEHIDFTIRVDSIATVASSIWIAQSSVNAYYIIGSVGTKFNKQLNPDDFPATGIYDVRMYIDKGASLSFINYYTIQASILNINFDYANSFTGLSIYRNLLQSSINLSDKKSLLYLQISYSNITEVFAPYQIKALNILYNNQLQSIDLTNYHFLETLNLSYNPLLTSINIQSNLFLTIINVIGCANLSILTIDNCPAVISLDVSGCKLTSLAFNLPNCTTLKFPNNLVTTTDFSNMTKLVTFYGDNNLLNSIDISMLTKLKLLSIPNNTLNSLNVTNNVLLETLYIYANTIQSLIGLQYCVNLKDFNLNLLSGTPVNGAYKYNDIDYIDLTPFTLLEKITSVKLLNTVNGTRLTFANHPNLIYFIVRNCPNLYLPALSRYINRTCLWNANPTTHLFYYQPGYLNIPRFLYLLQCTNVYFNGVLYSDNDFLDGLISEITTNNLYDYPTFFTLRVKKTKAETIAVFDKIKTLLYKCKNRGSWTTIVDFTNYDVNTMLWAISNNFTPSFIKKENNILINYTITLSNVGKVFLVATNEGSYALGDKGDRISIENGVIVEVLGTATCIKFDNGDGTSTYTGSMSFYQLTPTNSIYAFEDTQNTIKTLS